MVGWTVSSVLWKLWASIQKVKYLNKLFITLYFSDSQISIFRLNNVHFIDNSLVVTDTVNKAGDTPLSLACANGHLDTVMYLVNEHHCDPRSTAIIINCYITQ